MENSKKKVSYNKEFRSYVSTQSAIIGFTCYPCTMAAFSYIGANTAVLPAVNPRQLLRNHRYLNKHFPNGSWYDPKRYSH